MLLSRLDEIDLPKRASTSTQVGMPATPSCSTEQAATWLAKSMATAASPVLYRFNQESSGKNIAGTCWVPDPTAG